MTLYFNQIIKSCKNENKKHLFFFLPYIIIIKNLLRYIAMVHKLNILIKPILLKQSVEKLQILTR